MIDKEMIVAMLQQRFVTKQELQDILNLDEREVRRAIQAIKLDYPVISSCNRKRWKIATAEADIPLVTDSLKDNRKKAVSIFAGQRHLREFLKSFNHDYVEQLTLDL